MASVPDQLTLKRHRDLVGRERRPYIRWLLLALIGLVLLLGLANVFGQKPHTDTAAADGVELEVYSPEHLRSGLFFMSRFTIRAERELEAATLLLDPGWLEGITLNTLVPSPVGEANRDGRIAFDLGRVPRRHRARLLPPLPGQPDRDRAAAAGRRAARRRDAAPRHRPHGDHLPLMDLVIRAAVAFAFVYLITRVIGRRELSSLQPFDLILLVMIGDLVQQGVTQNDFSVTGAILVGGTIALLTVAVSYLSFRFPRLRPALDGEPVIVVEDGKPIERNLRRNRITLEELAAAARQSQIASIDDVRWGVLETNGQISFIPKS